MELVASRGIARDFWAGQYAKVVEATFDAPDAPLPDDAIAFVVGALTFLGRIDDAELVFDAWRRRRLRDVRTLAASRFFLGVAYARAGSFQRAHEYLVEDVRARLREGDAWSRAFMFQGLACHRYFTGRYRLAAEHARRAMRSAHEAKFPYAMMLATDLRGHALVQIGQLRAGLSLLGQAKTHAERLDFGMNAHAIECSIATYAVKFTAGDEALRDIEAMLERKWHDSYSRHALLTEAASALALRGRRVSALRALEQADAHALATDTRRAKVASVLARLAVTRFSEGARACAGLVAQARDLVDAGDATFRAELLGFEALVARATGDDGVSSAALAALRTLDLHWARAALEQLGEGPERVRAFPEDQLAPLFRAAVTRDVRALPRMLSFGLLGLVPEVLGLEPAERVIVLSTENAILLEDRGELALRTNPPRWCPALLRLLSAGDVSKEAIVAEMWGLRAYRPERHDPLIRTTIHRLRAFLGPFARFVRVTPSGYGTSVPVHFVGTIDEHEPLLVDDEPPTIEITKKPTAVTVSIPDRVHEKLVALGSASVRDVARAIDVSESTALRALRALLAEGRVVRRGFARATRYAPAR